MMKIEPEEQLKWLHHVSEVRVTPEGRIIPVFSAALVTEEEETEAIQSCIKALSPMREELERIYG